MEAVDNEERWRAVLARDPRADGAFVYAVRSTGIYCRPTCPSRRPRPDRVAFFAGPEAAERAGFRACRRCRPAEEPAPDPQLDLIRRVCGWIEEHDDGPPSLDSLGERAGISPTHLQKTFKRLTGTTPRQYAEACRLERLKAGLRRGEPLARAIFGAGFGSGSRLYEQSDGRLGMTPAVYRRGGEGMTIGYTLADSPLGRLLVAATDRGLCALYLGDHDPDLEAALRAEYPRAEVGREDAGLGARVGAILAYLEGRGTCDGLPVDIRQSAFRARVSEALRAIPAGTTRTYGAIARSLGQPTATRAVARCCATNPVALVIPCHRVVREDGALAGYRWGLERKSSLLELERAKADGEITPGGGP